MNTLPAAIATLLAFACGTSVLEAQNLRGSVQERDGRPVTGALVVLSDSAGLERVKVLTGRDGSFILRAPAAGRYQLRVERIGIRTPAVQEVALFADSTVVRSIRVASQAIELPPLTAAAKRRCTSHPAQGEVVAQLWEEARKALRAVDAAQADVSWQLRIRRFERRLDPGALHVLRDSSFERLELWSTTPFASAPVADLLARGFIQHTDSGTLYFAPDANVLLSEAFAQAYCLTPREDPRNGLLGISFQPAAGRGPPAVRGTLWLDARTLELRHLDYGYTRADLPSTAARHSGGRVELQRLPDGMWSIARWRIRFPLLNERPLGVGSVRGTQQSVRVLQEVGGEVLEVVDREGRVVRALATPSLAGIAFDSIAGAPLAHATVFLSGTSYATTTSERGEYHFAGLPEGRYLLGISHPRLAVYGVSLPTRSIGIEAQGERREDWHVPSDVARSRCARRSAAQGYGVLAGRVSERSSRASLTGATVEFSWSADSSAQRRVVETDRAGGFVACWVPTGVPLTARVLSGPTAGPPMAVAPLPASGFASVDLISSLAATAPVPVTLALDDMDTGLPVRDVSVRTGADVTPQLTDEAGRVRLTLLPGTHQLRLEHVAYGTFVDTIRIEEAATVMIRLRRSAIRLGAIEVRAETPAVAARVTRGAAATILTRRDIEPLEKRARHVGDLLRDVPGIRVRELRPARAGGVTTGICIESSRGDAVLRSPGACASVLVVLDGVPVPAAEGLADFPAETLRGIPPAAIESIEFIPPAEAGARYGTGSMNGVLVIYTRGNGPFAAGR